MDRFVVFIIVVGVLFAIATICSFIEKRHPKDISGFIIVDKYDPDGPYMFFELGEPIEELCERETAMVGIIVRDPSSQD